MSEDDGTRGPCDLCGPLVPRATLGRIVREVHHQLDDGQVGDHDLFDVSSCSREHASAWFDRPLPRRPPREVHRPSWRDDRDLAGIAIVGALVACTALSLIGLHAILGLLRGWLVVDRPG